MNKDCEIINLTHHDVVIADEDEKIVEVFKSNGIVRASTKTDKIEELNGIPLTETVIGNVNGLGKEKEDLYIIVSRLIAEMLRNERSDLLIPNETVRNDKGQIIGCKSLAKL